MPRASVKALASSIPRASKWAKTSLPSRFVRAAKCPSRLRRNTSDVRHARFRLCDDTRRRGTAAEDDALGTARVVPGSDWKDRTQ